MHQCVNNTIGNVYHLEQWVDNFFPYSQKQLGFDQPVNIIFQSDEDNAAKMLGKTAYYDPENRDVVLYTDGRHPKDVMRSLSHELVHHAQNCRGDFTSSESTAAGYAQEDPHLRDMESEAYEKGNLIFRDFEDLIKTGKINIEIDFSDSGEPKMSLKEWKNDEINTKLMKKWGLLREVKEVTAEEAEELVEAHDGPHGLECGCPIQEESDMMYRDEDIGSKESDNMTGDDYSLTHDLEDEKALDEDSGEDEAWNDWKNEHADDDHIREIEHHLRALRGDRDHERDDAEDELEEGSAGDWSKMAMKSDPSDLPGGLNAADRAQITRARKGPKVSGRKMAPLRAKGGDNKPAEITLESNSGSGKISVREAKEITRRIIRRAKQESK